jgi:hypothetical protein
MDQKQLAHLFEKLGASDPEAWARSQIEESIPQLERFLFLRQAWRGILKEDDAEWTKHHIAYSNKHPDAPYADIGKVLNLMLEKGVPQTAINTLVRCVQAESLFHFCYLLEDPGDLEEEVENVSWRLFQTDEEGNPIQEIGMLHESVLETDPTGREMRPRKGN